MAVSSQIVAATQALLAQVESLQRQLEEEEERYAGHAGLRLPEQFQEDVSYPYRLSAYAGPEDAAGIKRVIDAVAEAEFALAALSAACLAILPPDHARRRILWTRLHVGFLTPDVAEGDDPLRQSWEGRS